MTDNSSSDSTNETQALDPFEVAIDTLRHGRYRESLGGVNPTGASAKMINERAKKSLLESAFVKFGILRSVCIAPTLLTTILNSSL